MRQRQTFKDYVIDRDVRKKRDIWQSKGARGLGCRYKEWGNMECFGKPNC